LPPPLTAKAGIFCRNGGDITKVETRTAFAIYLEADE